MAFTLYPDVLTNIVAGILIIGFGIFAGNILSVVAKKVFQSFEIDRILLDLGLRFPVEELLAALIKYGLYLVGLLFGLAFLKLDQILLSIVLFSILGLLLLFILLSFRDFIPNFIAGLTIYFKGKLRLGDIVEIDTIEGKVIHMDMLEAKIRTTDGDVVIMPNVLALKGIIIKKRKMP